MEFNFFTEEKGEYKKIRVEPPANSNWKYFTSLKLTLERENNKIREKILSLFPNGENVNLKKPVSDNFEIQKKINLLVKMKKVNLMTIQSLLVLLSIEDFIVCERCDHKMFKTPIGVNYNKVGTRFILKDIMLHEQIKFVYMCENCIYAISEVLYNEEQRNLSLREKLLSKGETFIPNKYGYWSHIHA